MRGVAAVGAAVSRSRQCGRNSGKLSANGSRSAGMAELADAVDSKSVYELAGVRERCCKGRPQLGKLWAVLLRMKTVGSAPDERLSYGVANKGDWCIILSLSI